MSGSPPYPAGSFDRVLLDVPCSALGQRPAARNRMTLKSLQSYPVYQKRFIDAVSTPGIKRNLIAQNKRDSQINISLIPPQTRSVSYSNAYYIALQGNDCLLGTEKQCIILFTSGCM